jgi:hypothetical protein
LRSSPKRKIRRGIYRSVAGLRAEIASFLELRNRDPNPFRWTKTADDILKSIERLCFYNAPSDRMVEMPRTSGSGH